MSGPMPSNSSSIPRIATHYSFPPLRDWCLVLSQACGDHCIFLDLPDRSEVDSRDIQMPGRAWTSLEPPCSKHRSHSTANQWYDPPLLRPVHRPLDRLKDTDPEGMIPSEDLYFYTWDDLLLDLRDAIIVLPKPSTDGTDQLSKGSENEEHLERIKRIGDRHNALCDRDRKRREGLDS